MNTRTLPRLRWLAAVVLLAFGLAWSGGVAGAGDDDQRIEFAPGTDSASVSGTFREGEVDNFVLRASAGQTMFISVTPAEAGASVSVRDPNGAQIAEPPEPGADFSVRLPSTGDYVISVGPGRSEVSAYTLNVRIPAESPPPSGGPQRIQFAPGTDSATVSGSIVPGTTVSYVLRAAAGQTMEVSVGPDQFAALTTIFGPDGDVVGAGHTTASATLPVTGDYVVEIGNTGSTNDYTVTFRIPARSSSPSPAPGGVQRIQFAPGTEQAIVSGTFGDAVDDRYVLRATAGQMLSILLGPDPGMDLQVLAPDGSELPGNVTFPLPTTGDYTIVVAPGSAPSPNYTMTVMVPPVPRRIEFAPGTNTASVVESVGPEQTDSYLLRAGAGQTMVVHVDSEGDNASPAILAPDGTFLAADEPQLTVTLPSDGDYTVWVRSLDGTATYRISFWIA